MTKTPVDIIIFNDGTPLGVAYKDVLVKISYGQAGFTDEDLLLKNRTLGAYKIAHELRLEGYTVQVIDFISHLPISIVKKFLDKFVGSNTLALAFSTTWFSTFAKSVVDQTKAEKDMLPDPMEDIPEPSFINALCPQGNEYDKMMIDHARSINPNVKIIAGGARVRAEYSQPLVDIHCSGDGDVIIKEALADLKKGSHKSFYSDWESRLPIRTSTMHWYPEDCLHQGEMIPIEASRGCIFKCKFCSFHLIGKKKGTYIRDMNLIRDEIMRNYDNYGITDYFVTCDTFNDTNDKVDSWLKMSKSLPFDLSYTTFLRLDLIYSNQKFGQAEKLAESGLKVGILGIETLGEENAKAIGKGLNPMKQIEFVSEMKKSVWKSVGMSSGFILGLPYDDRKAIVDTLRFLNSEECPLDVARVTPLYLSKFKQFNNYISGNMEDYGYVEDREAYVKGSLFGGRAAQYMLHAKDLILWKNRYGITMLDCFKYLGRWSQSYIKNRGARLFPELLYMGIGKYGIKPGEFKSEEVKDFHKWNLKEADLILKYIDNLMAIESHSSGFIQPVACDLDSSPFDLDSGELLDNTIIPTYNIT